MFTENQIKLAAAASAMAHPVKVAILECLNANDEWHEGCLANKINLPQEAVYKGMQELRALGLIEGSIVEESMRFRLNKENWQEFRNYITNNLINNL
jgi:predicted transcriptional regulator